MILASQDKRRLIFCDRRTHAHIRSIDTTAARAAPGVIAIFTGADLEGKVNGPYLAAG
jgi:xanthine dehydrogenase molybdopterin-binding subunit B